MQGNGVPCMDLIVHNEYYFVFAPLTLPATLALVFDPLIIFLTFMFVSSFPIYSEMFSLRYS